MRLRSFTITDLSSDGSAAVTVEAYDNTSALRAYAEECGFETLGELLANRGIEIGDLAVHAD